MNATTKERLRTILQKMNTLDYIRPEAIPDIALYMDQLTSFMDSELSTCKRYPDDKLLTKTMINNYAKNDLIPPPEKKKYSKEHLLLLIYIYYLKSFLSISDIHEILNPIIEGFYRADEEITLTDIYRQVYENEMKQSEDTVKDIMKRYLRAEQTFADADLPEEKKLYLQFFSFICMLGFDVYVKKQVIESLIDMQAAEMKKTAGKGSRK